MDTDSNKKCKTGWLKKKKAVGHKGEFSRSRENKGQKGKNTVPSLRWAQDVLGGRKPSPALLATVVTIPGMCGPGKTSFLFGPRSSHLEMETLAQRIPKGLAHLGSQ